MEKYNDLIMLKLDLIIKKLNAYSKRIIELEALIEKVTKNNESI